LRESIESVQTLDKPSPAERGMAEPEICKNWDIECKLAKIVLHLGDIGSRLYIDKWDVPSSITQTDIADAVNMSRSNISRYAPDLIEWGFVESKVKHILNGSRKKTAYFLTYSGMKVYSMLQERREIHLRIQNNTND